MHTSRLVLLGGLTVVGALLAVSSGCGDDGGGEGGSSSTTTTSSSSSSGQGGKDDGSGGNSSVEPTCEAYCSTIMANCTGENEQFKTVDTCLGTCAGWEVGTADSRMEATVGCHLYHAGAAAGDAAAMHCPHAGPAGAGQCGDMITNLCDIALDVCPDVWQDEAACKAELSGVDATAPFSTAATSGDTLACRLYHLTAAAESDAAAMTHCAHVQATSAPCAAP
jgi:hypothetical protein